MKLNFFIFFILSQLSFSAESFFLLESGRTLKIVHDENNIQLELKEQNSENPQRILNISTDDFVKFIDSQLSTNLIKSKSGLTLLGFKSVMSIMWSYVFWGHLSENHKVTKYLSKHRKKFMTKKEKLLQKKWIKNIFGECSEYISNLPEFLWLGENIIEAGYGLYLYQSSSQAQNNYSYLKENMKKNVDEGKILKDKYVLKIFEVFEKRTNQL